MWRGGVVVRVLGLATERSQVQVPAAPLHVTTLGKLFTKQYKLVPATGWECNRRSGVALAMRRGLNGLGNGDKYPA